MQNCNSSRRCKELRTAVQGGMNRSKLCKRTFRPDLRKTFVYHGGTSWNKEYLSEGRCTGKEQAGDETAWTVLRGAGRCCQSPQAAPMPPPGTRGQHQGAGCHRARLIALQEFTPFSFSHHPPAPPNPSPPCKAKPSSADPVPSGASLKTRSLPLPLCSVVILFKSPGQYLLNL